MRNHKVKFQGLPKSKNLNYGLNRLIAQVFLELQKKERMNRFFQTQKDNRDYDDPDATSRVIRA